jgi:hypothetical protein
MATLKNTNINDTGYLQLPSGTTAQRPVSPNAGYIRWNTTTSTVELYTGISWIEWETTSPLYVTSNLLVYLDAGDTSSYPGTGTTWTDLTGNGYNGTLINGPTYSSLNQGYIVTDGTNDYTLVGRVPGTGTSTQSLTFEVWVNPSDNDGNIMSMSSANPQTSWNMPPIAATGGQFRGKIWSNNYLYSSAFTQGNWYQVVLVFNYSTSTQEFFINGTSVDSQSGITYGSSGANNYLFLGQANPGADNTGDFAGKYGIFRIYNKALTASEVLQNFNAHKSRYGI